MNLPPHPFWLLLLCACLVWYGGLLLYIGWKGIHDIRTMLASLRPPMKTSGGESTGSRS